jgi:hypothetical protein
MLCLDEREARDLTDRAARGDAEAKAFFSSLFPATALCFLCDREVGVTGALVAAPDPQNPGMVVVAPECESCASAPTRHVREIAMLASMFPQRKWKHRKDEQPGYLRGSRAKR